MSLKALMSHSCTLLKMLNGMSFAFLKSTDFYYVFFHLFDECFHRVSFCTDFFLGVWHQIDNVKVLNGASLK